jgi:squalene-hopene/tetraprenyl-beta-curcumene cyclase
VLNALILAVEDAQAGRDQPGEHTQKALRQLWETQRADGSWDWMNFAQEPDESTDSQYYGAALAAIAVGLAPGSRTEGDEATANYVGRLRAYLGSRYGEQNLYRQTWALLASTRLAGVLNADQRHSLIAALEQKQNQDGGWSLYRLGPWRWSKAAAPFAPPSALDNAELERSDGYATGLVAYTLRQAGVPATAPVLQNATAWLKANQKEVQVGQNSWKCWRTRSLNYDREQGGPHGGPWKQMLMSDAATAFAVLALCSD